MEEAEGEGGMGRVGGKGKRHHQPVTVERVSSNRVTCTDSRFQYGDPTLSGFSCCGYGYYNYNYNYNYNYHYNYHYNY